MLTIAYIDSDAPEGSEVSIGSFSATVHFGNNGTIKSDYTDINDTINTGVSLDSYLVDSTAEFKNNITINFYFVGEDGEGNYKIPEYADGFLGGYLYTHPWESADDGSIYTDATEATKLMENTQEGAEGSTIYYYSITLDKLYNGNVRFDIYFEHTSKESGDGASLVEWIHVETEYSVDKYLEDGSTIKVDVYANPSTYIQEEQTGGLTYETMNINIVTINTASQNASSKTLYITGGDGAIDDGDEAYFNQHFTMSDISGSAFSQYGSIGNYYTFENWDKTKDLQFCVHVSGSDIYGNYYWESAVLPSTNIAASDDNYHLWSYWNGKESGQDGSSWWVASWMGISVTANSEEVIGPIQEMTLVLSFDYSQLKEWDNVQVDMSYAFYIS